MRFLGFLLPLLVASPAIAGLISPVLLKRIDSPPGFSRFGQSVDEADLDGDGVLDFAIGETACASFPGRTEPSF